MAKLNPRNTLAEGEVTGHAHVADAGTVLHHEDGRRELLAPDGCSVTHEEHKRVTLPPGEYDVTIQREIDPDTEEARRVAD